MAQQLEAQASAGASLPAPFLLLLAVGPPGPLPPFPSLPRSPSLSPGRRPDPPSLALSDDTQTVHYRKCRLI